MSTTFASLGVPENLVRALSAAGIDAPFPIQAATIPDALAGRDLCGKAATGSGKTIAFGVPLLARVHRAAPKRPKGLVLVPTRELAVQVADELRRLSGDVRVLAVYGGAGLEPQIKKLRQGVDIVVACPGRLADLIDRNTCSLRDVEVAVVDEADRMADMGFLPEVKRLLDQAADDRQTLLFSATLDGAIDELVKRYQHDPVVHEMAEEPTGRIDHHFWMSERPGRVALTAQIIDRVGPTIVFCRTRHGADRVAKQLASSGVRSAAIHGARTQGQRERALNDFHRGQVAALVATDVAARGIHVTGVQCVVHFDLPEDPKDYVHRSGRTGRAGADGQVVALVEPSKKRDAARLRRDAAVHAELVAPAVAVLIEGPAGMPTRRPSAPRHDDRPERSTPRDRGPRPERRDRTSERSSQRPRRESSDRDRNDRDRRPFDRDESAGDRRPHERRRVDTHHADRRPATSAPVANRSSRPVSASPNPDMVLDGGQDRPSASEHAGAGPRTKVRPSGAARRKAKREAQQASGVTPDRNKRKRSGRPRPPKSQRVR